MKKINLLSLILTLLQFGNTKAQDGSLDNSFGINGIVTTGIGNNTYQSASSVKIQSDGKIVVAGTTNNGGNRDFAVVRYNTDGSLDTTFDFDGKVTTDIGGYYDSSSSISIQTDGKIVVSGISNNGVNDDFAVVRYNTDGSLDTTFDFDGKVTTDIGGYNDTCRSIAIQTDGKILVSGYFNNGLNLDIATVRYNDNGSMDSSFDVDGKVTTAVGNLDDICHSIILQNDGKIVLGGYSFILDNSQTQISLIRYNTNGSLDTSFDSDGKVLTSIGNSYDFGRAISIQNDGKIVVVGNSVTNFKANFAILRYNVNGSLDTSFDSDGIVTTAIGNENQEAYSVAIQNDGKIIAAGYSYNPNNNFALIRYNSNGSLDNTFDSDGIVTTTIGNGGGAYAVAIQNDGKIIAAGDSYITNTNISIVRYNNNTLKAPTFDFENKPIISIYPNPFNDFATIKFERPINGEITLYNLYGQKVKTLKNTFSEKLILERDNLTNGLYFIELSEENKVISKSKILIE